ncbi:MAG TPA: hypothetical protein VFE33_22145 [Thermoanaerobaculia bacterium]|nr:hypothetical protein [Thermoanaerobaculia bacterium]
MTKNKTNSINLIGASGFPYQIRVQHEVEVHSERHGWAVVAPELRWTDASTGSDGYADLVVEKDDTRLILECKKAKESPKWVFLIPRHKWQEEGGLSSATNARLFWTSHEEMEGWADIKVAPTSFRSAYCVIDRKLDQANYMLEKICNSLLLSVESVARQELKTKNRRSIGFFIFYAAVIVTNAELEVCLLDPEDINLHSGTVEHGTEPPGCLREVQWIRFQKSLFSTARSPAADNLKGVNVQDERTVFVVRGDSLASFLENWNARNTDFVQSWLQVNPR